MAIRSTALLAGIVARFALSGGSIAPAIPSRNTSNKIRFNFHSYSGKAAPSRNLVLPMASYLIGAAQFTIGGGNRQSGDGEDERARRLGQTAGSNDGDRVKHLVTDAPGLKPARPDLSY